MNTISWLGGPFSEEKTKNKNENKCKEKQQVNKNMKKNCESRIFWWNKTRKLPWMAYVLTYLCCLANLHYELFIATWS